MRRLSYIAMLLVLVITSCTGMGEYSGNGPYIELTLICNDSVITKAGNNGNKDGQDRYNEQNVHMVFYIIILEQKMSYLLLFWKRQKR